MADVEKKAADVPAADAPKLSREEKKKLREEKRNERREQRASTAADFTQSKRNDAACLVVDKVPLSATWQNVKDMARKAGGNVACVELVVAADGKSPAGRALVTFETAAEATAALAALASGAKVNEADVTVAAFSGQRPNVISGNFTKALLVELGLLEPRKPREGGRNNNGEQLSPEEREAKRKEKAKARREAVRARKREAQAAAAAAGGAAPAAEGGDNKPAGNRGPRRRGPRGGGRGGAPAAEGEQQPRPERRGGRGGEGGGERRGGRGGGRGGENGERRGGRGGGRGGNAGSN